MAIMQRKHVQHRLRANVTGRDVAWAQMHDPDLLVKAEIPFLTTQQLNVVKEVYADQGGLDAEFLDCREDLYDILPDGSYIVIDNDHKSDMVMAMQHRDHVREFTGVRRLQQRYGQLEIEQNKANAQESPDIPQDAIPVGVLKWDEAPARLVTATIDLSTTSLFYKVRPLDKSFVYVQNHNMRTTPTGHEWQSTENVVDDMDQVAFRTHLQHFTYDELMRYVFDEQKQGETDIVWTTYDDMLSYPELWAMINTLTRFAHSDHVDGTTNSMTTTCLSRALSDMVQDLITIGLEAEVNLDQIESGPYERKREMTIDAMRGLWQSLGSCVRVFLRRRQGMEDVLA